MAVDLSAEECGSVPCQVSSLCQAPLACSGPIHSSVLSGCIYCPDSLVGREVLPQGGLLGDSPDLGYGEKQCLRGAVTKWLNDCPGFSPLFAG